MHFLPVSAYYAHNLKKKKIKKGGPASLAHTT